MFYDMVNALNSMETTTNDLKAFKEFVEAQRNDPNSQLAQALNGVQYTYDLDMLVYTKNVDGTVIQADTQQLLQELLIEYFGMNMSAMTNMSESNGMGMGPMMMAPGSTSAKLFQEMLPGDNGKPVSKLLENQYDVIYGSCPTPTTKSYWWWMKTTRSTI
jgi:putative ABC transport system permease protein